MSVFGLKLKKKTGVMSCYESEEKSHIVCRCS